MKVFFADKRIFGLGILCASFLGLCLCQNKAEALYISSLSASIDSSKTIEVDANEMTNEHDGFFKFEINGSYNGHVKNGFYATISTASEEQALVPTRPQNPTKINPLPDQREFSDFENNMWGYKLRDNTKYSPIPKKLAREKFIESEHESEGNYTLDVGMRIGRNLSDDVYSNKIVVSFVANPFGNARVGIRDSFASFFLDHMATLANGKENIEYIKRSNVPPSSDKNIKHVESVDSRYEVVVWYEQETKTAYYFTDGEKITLPQLGNQMFVGMNNLKEIDLSNFDTSEMTSFYQMFMGLPKIKTLDLSGFNTNKIDVMLEMLADMPELEMVNLSNFNMSRVSYIGEMFRGDSKLKTIYANSDLVPGGPNRFLDWLGVFKGCVSLVGGNGSKMAESELSYSSRDWMRIDRPGVPGYLTMKSN